MWFTTGAIAVWLWFGVNQRHVTAQSWTVPELIDAATPDIVLEQLVGRFGITMNEEIPWPFTLVKINYDGPGIPYVSRYNTGTRDNLQLSFVKDENSWLVRVQNRQDYENLDQQHYDIEFGINQDSSEASKRVRVIIATINIFDNAPRITYDGPCMVEELQSNVDTECKFTVYHPDGILNNPFRLVITGRFDEERKFGFTAPYNEQSFSRDYNLKVLEELRFEQRAMYNFVTTVFDVVQNSSSIPTLLQVIDVPSMPPMWTKPFSTARFLEKTAQEFSVIAVDGDTDINKDIWYELGFYDNQNYSEHIAIDKERGTIAVKPINRDALKQEIFPFYIVAYKYDNRSWAIDGEAVIVVDDVNDNKPVVLSSHKQLSIMENTYLTLPIDQLSVNDIDLGVHATYTVSLDGGRTAIDYATPFLMIPDNGYQESFFTITITDTKLLDFEVPSWQQINLTIVATEIFNEEHIGTFDFTIDLLNWNDELPIFAQSVYELEILETTGNVSNVNIITITATDRDIGDKVIHSIVGVSDLSITEDGQIWTTSPNTFDYERQPLVIVQIQAMDTLQINGIDALHTSYAQLQIKLIDVNDKTPEMRMPRNSPNMDENTLAPFVVTSEGIIATDPDTTADIRFTIDWKQTYATKAGQEANRTLYENCFLIDADTTNRNRVIGYVMVNPEFPYLIDYEEYEVIYLHIIATDHNQEINDNSTDAVLTIRINDVNDNYPLFILDTLQTARSVIEEAAPRTLVGTIFALDIDGPQFNKITYTMEPATGTPAGIIDINPLNGEMRVAEGAVVGCDQPVIYNLTYMITLSDGELTTTDQVDIWIYDINNRVPAFGQFETTVRRYENITTGELIQQITSTDADRDAPHNVIQYTIDYSLFANLDQYIQIDAESGVLQAQLQGNAIFDRDRGYQFFDIQIIIHDNYRGNGRVNQDSKMLKLILLDVNDNAPELPAVENFKPVISENAQKDSLVDTILATDIDDASTPNARIGYAILSVRPLGENKQPPPDAADLFRIDASSGAIQLGVNASGFYGHWAVQIEAYDHGHEWDSHIQLRSDATYTITVEPYNFHTPEIVSPSRDGLLYRLSFYEQQVSRPLALIDGTPFPLLRAVDDDGGIFGEVSFDIGSFQDNTDAAHFNVLQVDGKSAQLYLQRPVEARFYHLNVRGVDGGGRRSEWTTNLTLVFVDMSGEPVFDVPIWQTDFTENITGLDEVRTFPMALDPKNIGIEDSSLLTKIYYFIDPNYRPEDAKLFKLNLESRELSLAQQLDREHIDNHMFRVVATNRQSNPLNPQSSAFLTINVTVNDVNDNPPRFEYSSYGSGITTLDAIGKHVLTVKAFDPDLDDVITYVIKGANFTASDSSLADIVRNNPFELHPDTGELQLNFAVSTAMKGFITFEVQAFDLVFHEDVCDVKIFIIAESNRVTFMFLNTKDEVDQQRERIGKLLSESYEYECFIDDVTKADVDGVAQDTMTALRVHFIQNNEAIESATIFSRSNDVLFIGHMKSALLSIGINLLDVPSVQRTDEVPNDIYILQMVLIGVCVVLGIILIALIVFFTVRERSMSRQLKALSTTMYEPAEAITAKRAEPPNTNVFSVEGLNADLRVPSAKTFESAAPYSFENHRQDIVFDNLSLISGSSQSDFIGIEDDPTFISKGNATGANVAVINVFGARHAADDEKIFQKF